MTLALTDIAQRDTVRLISTSRLKGPALLPLAATDAALEALASLESATDRRLRAEASGLPNLAARDLVWGRPGRHAHDHTIKGWLLV